MLGKTNVNFRVQDLKDDDDWEWDDEPVSNLWDSELDDDDFDWEGDDEEEDEENF